VRFPDLVAYQAAVQHPEFAFADADLRQAAATINRLGLPRVAAGNFALTYQLTRSGRRWAVRCFHRDAIDRPRRYAAISNTLAAIRGGPLVTIAYLADGVRVDQHWYPITKMPWLDGRPFNRAVEQRLGQPTELAALERQFQALVDHLRHLGIAHGDLQHGNILVDPASGPRLVDYDGMFVPSLKGLRANESGDPNYQHPARTDQFDAELDRFATLVIVVALRAVALAPDLWQTYNTDDNLLFRRADFAAPARSALFRDLCASPATRPLAERLGEVCEGEYARIPLLADFLRSRVQVTAPPPRTLDLVALNTLYRLGRPASHATSASPTARSWTVRRAASQEALATSPDGRMLATAERGGKVRLRDASSGRVVRVWTHGEGITALAFSADARQLVATGAAGALYLRATSGTAAAIRLSTSPGAPRAVVFAVDRPVLAVADGRNVRIYEPTGGRNVILKALAREVSSLSFSARGHLLAAGASDGSLRCWSVETLALVAAARQSVPASAVAFSGDGRVLASATTSGVRLWRIPGGSPAADLVDPGQAAAVPERVALNHDASRAIAAIDGRVVIWDTAGSTATHEFASPGPSVTDLTFSPDEQFILMTTASGAVWCRSLVVSKATPRRSRPARLRPPVAQPRPEQRPVHWLLDVLRRASAAARASL
jgi:WD40 repeat protein